MLKVTIEIEGDRLADVMAALTETARQLESGIRRGSDESDDGSYRFTVVDSEG